jgi:hypothetical protein
LWLIYRREKIEQKDDERKRNLLEELERNYYFGFGFCTGLVTYLREFLALRITALTANDLRAL